jgi:hypothetical protein
MLESRCVGDTAQPPSVRMIQIAGSTGSRLSMSSTPRERFLECEFGNLRDLHCVTGVYYPRYGLVSPRGLGERVWCSVVNIMSQLKAAATMMTALRPLSLPEHAYTARNCLGKAMVDLEMRNGCCCSKQVRPCIKPLQGLTS